MPVLTDKTILIGSHMYYEYSNIHYKLINSILHHTGQTNMTMLGVLQYKSVLCYATI